MNMTLSCVASGSMYYIKEYRNQQSDAWGVSTNGIIVLWSGTSQNTQITPSRYHLKRKFLFIYKPFFPSGNDVHMCVCCVCCVCVRTYTQHTQHTHTHNTHMRDFK